MCGAMCGMAADRSAEDLRGRRAAAPGVAFKDGRPYCVAKLMGFSPFENLIEKLLNIGNRGENAE